MNINLTILGQSIAFIIFVAFCMKFVWPPLVAAMNERQRRISDGLNAAEQAKADLVKAEQEAELELKEAKLQAQKEGERIRQQAQTSIDQEINHARDNLRQQVAQLAVLGAEKILQEKVDEQKHASMLEQLAAKL